jgi:hypothetical protein
MRRLLDIIFLIVIIFTLNGIKDELHHACDILTNLDKNIAEVEVHTSELEKPEDMLARREYQRKAIIRLTEHNQCLDKHYGWTAFVKNKLRPIDTEPDCGSPFIPYPYK